MTRLIILHNVNCDIITFIPIVLKWHSMHSSDLVSSWAIVSSLSSVRVFVSAHFFYKKNTTQWLNRIKMPIQL